MNKLHAAGPVFMYRRLLAILMTIAAGLIASSCTPADFPIPNAMPTRARPVPIEPTATASPTPNPMPVTLRYVLWDAMQAPAYEACAQQFMALYPYITVQVEQYDSSVYWEMLNAGFQHGDAPDVFANHLTRLPDMATNGHILDIEPLVQRDQIDDTIYLGRLPRLWIRAGVRYGLPKDWDTIALIYNQELLDAAGVTVEEINRLEWNPENGGTFQQVLGRLTVDVDGHNALSPDFDPQRVAHYGLTMAGKDAGGAYGQQQWSYLAASNGFHFTDHLYANNYHYEDPALIETMAWYQRLIDELGYHVPFAQIAEEDGQQLFLRGKAALIADGSWTIRRYVNDSPFKVGFARLPVGPQGRKSMFNGLADSIWSGTAHPEAAWQWVKYLGSVDCQLTVGSYAVVFPAIQSGVERVVAAYEELGIDVSAFTQQAVAPDGVFLFPVTEHAADVNRIVRPAIEAILRGEADPATELPKVDAQVDALFDSQPSTDGRK